VARRTNKIARNVRRNVFDLLSLRKVAWHGRMDEVAFLERIWDLSDLPSKDYRFSDAAGDIYQHRINNWDWEPDWIFSDDRFDLLGCPDDQFLTFLAEMLHPVVRPDADEARELADMLNDALAKSGWHLAATESIGGHPVFEARKGDVRLAPKLEVDDYTRLDDPAVLQDHLGEIDISLTDNPPSAITASKDLVESVCKLILDDYDVDYRRGDDLLELYKKTAKALRLNAEAVPDSSPGSKAAQKTLRTLSTTVQSLAELRNELGRGHGRTRRSPALARHARLAANAARTVSEFLLDTWHVRRGE
jgi:hypothetical protein